jgi:hypothetical protein
MMRDLELLRKFADGHAFPFGKSFNREQSLMLAGRQAGCLSGFLAETKKLSKVIAKCSQQFVLGFREAWRGFSESGSHWSSGLRQRDKRSQVCGTIIPVVAKHSSNFAVFYGFRPVQVAGRDDFRFLILSHKAVFALGMDRNHK